MVGVRVLSPVALALVLVFPILGSVRGQAPSLTEMRVRELEARLRSCESKCELPRSVLPWDPLLGFQTRSFPQLRWHERFTCSAVGLPSPVAATTGNVATPKMPPQGGSVGRMGVHSDFGRLRAVVVGRADGFRLPTEDAEPLVEDEVNPTNYLNLETDKPSPHCLLGSFRIHTIESVSSSSNQL